MPLVLAFALSLAALALIVPGGERASAGQLHDQSLQRPARFDLDVLVDHVTDFAEIPTFTERRTMDTNSDGQVSDSEAATYAQGKCTALASDLELVVRGSRLPLQVTQLGISFPMGQGNPTMRLVCVYTAPSSLLSLHRRQSHLTITRMQNARAGARSRSSATERRSLVLTSRRLPRPTDLPTTRLTF